MMTNQERLAVYAELDARARAGGIPDDDMDAITDQLDELERQIAAAPCASPVEVAGVARICRDMYSEVDSEGFVNLPALLNRLVADLDWLAVA